jgi:hypothetical protein
MRQLLLSQAVEHVRLVLPPVNTPQQLVFAIPNSDPCIVSRRQKVSAPLTDHTEQRPKLYLTVADETGVRSAPPRIVVAEILYDLGLEFPFQIHQAERNAQQSANPPRVFYRSRSASGIL